VLDDLLADFQFSPTLFGLALFVQGTAAFLGTRFLSRASLVAQASLHRLEAQALLLLVVGGGVVYAADLVLAAFGLGPLGLAARLCGYALLGAGIGGSGILNNAFALRSSRPTHALNILNMAFTMGAVALPAFTAALLASADGLVPRWLWRIPVLGFLGSALLLSFICARQAGSMANAKPLADATEANVDSGALTPPSPPPAAQLKTAVVLASIVLFCYVGSEINLSNSWVPYLHDVAGLPRDVARLASPAFWGGLLAARAYFAFFTPPGRALSTYLRVFGLGVLACVVLALALPMVFPPAAQSPASSVAPIASAPWAGIGWLGLAWLTGLFIGSSYSFTLGIITTVANGEAASRAAFVVAQFGVLGAVCLPPLLGFVVDAGGFGAALAFVAFTMCVFTVSAFALGRAVNAKTIGKQETNCGRA
jgi:fucose permease